MTRPFCEATKDSFICSLKFGHTDDHKDLDQSGVYVGWPNVPAATQEQPAGSGALREHIELNLLRQLQWKEREVGDLGGWVRNEIVKRSLALSLSSPTEPPQRCPTCTSSVRKIKVGLVYGVLACPDIWHDAPTPQASEALLAAADYVNGIDLSVSEHTSPHDAAVNLAVKIRNNLRSRAEALAPSRQGAGEK